MTRIRFWLSAIAAAAMLAAGGSLHAQEGPAAPAPSAQAAPAGTRAESGLPAGMGVPCTLRSYVHVFIAFAVAWLLLFGYTLRVAGRFRRLEDEVRRLGSGGP